MCFDDIVSFDWPRRFFGKSRSRSRRGSFDDMFIELDEMMHDIEREFEDIEKWTSEDFVMEYTTPRHRNVREVGPTVYKYSITIGPNGRPKIREFRNVKQSRRVSRLVRSEISGKSGTGTEPLVDVITTDKEVKAIVQMPVVSKDRIKIYAYDNTVEVKSIDPQKRYHHTFKIPPETDIETVKSTYNNGILEITFNKRGQTKRKGKIVRVE